MTPGVAASGILTYSLHSIVVCVIASLINKWCVSSPAHRCVVWRAALTIPIVTATIVLATSGSRQAIGLAEPLRQFLPRNAARQEMLVDVRRAIGSPPIRKVTRDDPLATGASGAIVGIAVLLSAVGLSRLHAGRRSARNAVRDGDIVRTSVAQGLRSIELRTSETLRVPVALSGRKIRIPPSSIVDLERDQLEAVLLHEIAHVERRDPEWIDAARTIAAVTVWQPLNRRVLEALERDTELAADARAIRMGASPHSLVAALAYFAARLDEPLLAGAQLLRKDSPLVDRAKRLLRNDDVRQSRLGSAAALSIMMAVCAGLLLLPIASPARAANPGVRPTQGNGKLMQVERIEIKEGRQPLR